MTSGTTAYDAYRSLQFFSNLDGLRFLCIAMVIWHHSTPFTAAGLKLDNRGFLGVDFFFVISGYLITTLLLREASKHGSFSLRDFYIRRAIRIIPIYFFVVSGVAFYYIVLKGERQYLELLPYYYLFLSNFLTADIPTLSPTWSLSVEEQYYLIWPLLLMLLPQRWVVPALIILIFGNVLVMTGWVPVPKPIETGPLLIMMPNPTYAPILMGSLAAILLHRREAFEKIWPVLSHRIAPLIGVVLLIAAMEFLPVDLRGIPNFIVHGLMTLVLVSLVIRERNLFSPFLTNPVIARIGVISYGIYLYHLLALDVVVRAMTATGLTNPWLEFGGCFLLSCIIAEVSFRTLEAYFRRFRPKPRTKTGRPDVSGLDGVAQKER